MFLLGEELEVTNMRDLVVARAANGEKPLLICRGETLTYRDAHIRSNCIANSLKELGLGKGDVLATFMYNSVDHAAIWFACAKLGAIWAPLNVSLHKEDLLYSLIDSGAKFVVVDTDLIQAYSSVRADLPAGLVEILWQSPDREPVEEQGFLDFTTLLEASGDTPEVDIAPDDPLAIVYTGGSTSMPKGVLAPHLYYIAAGMRYRDIVEPVPDDVHFANSHFFHSGGQQFGVSGPLFCGITGVMTKWFSVSQYWKIVRETGATIIDPLGTMMSALLTRPPSESDTDHRVRLGIGIASGQVRRELRDQFEERFGIPLLEVYSMTEMGVLLFSERQHDRRAGSSGRSYGWADVMIADEMDMPLPPGVTGQILLRPNAPNTFMKEYVNKPAETLAAWRNLWYHTGDLGYLDEDGYLYFVGRKAYWIRRRGENVSAFEVEKVITAHEAVADCAVVGVPAELGEEDIKAYVQLKEGHTLDPAELVSWCAGRIAYFKVPRYIEFVTDFPRTLTKAEIARHELRALGVGNAWDSEASGGHG